jgi:uncharacterized protein (DUF2267 family)
MFQDTLVKTKEWLKAVEQELHFDNDYQAYVALKGVLHVLRDQLSLEEAVQLGAQFPMLIRGFYYEGWTPHKPSRNRRMEDFLFEVEQSINEDMDPVRVFKGIINVLEKKISGGEIEDIRGSLPKEIARLFPEKSSKA